MFLKEDDMSEELLRVIGLVVAAVVASGCALFALRVVLRRNTSASKNRLKAGDIATQVVIGGDYKGDINKK